MTESGKLNKVLSFGFLKPGNSPARFSVVQIILVLSLFGSVIPGSLCLYQKDYAFAILNLGIFLVLSGSVLFYVKAKKTRMYFFLVLLFSMILFVINFLSWGPGALHLFPVFSLAPILFIYITGVKRGSLLSAAAFLILLIISNPFVPIKGISEIPNAHFYEFTILYISIYILCFTFESRKNQIAYQLFKEKERVENSMQSRKEFTSNLSHQIRTPLNDLVVLSNILSGLKLDPEQKDIADTLKASTNNLVDVVQTISEVSSSKTGYLPPEKIQYNLISTVKSTLDFYKDKRIEGISLRLNETVIQEENVIGDPIILKQILLTLIENFIRNKSEKEDMNIELDITSLELDNKRIEYFFKLQTNHIIFSSRVQMQKIINGEIGRGETKSVKEEFQILNFSLGQKLVASLEGELKADMNSESSWFIFSLPFGKPEKDHFTVTTVPELPKDEKKKSKIKFEDVNLLLVEDNELNQKILFLGLKDYLKSIDLAVNGKEALDKFGSSRYDIILMDIQMEVMDGLTATRKIREIEKSTNTHVPIIAVTANALLGDKENCISAGMDDYISKPFKI
ncbi:MAG: response regulator, partial [Bacteroidota bacterium]|nr:response regulator [Bacteroidota bacterium]